MNEFYFQLADRDIPSQTLTMVWLMFKTQYYCKLESKAGTSESSFILNVFGVPGKVRGPIEAIDVDATEIHLD